MSSLCFFRAARTSSATSGDAGLDVSIPATTLAPNTGDIGLKLTLLAVRRFLLIDDMLLLRRRALPAALFVMTNHETRSILQYYYYFIFASQHDPLAPTPMHTYSVYDSNDLPAPPRNDQPSFYLLPQFFTASAALVRDSHRQSTLTWEEHRGLRNDAAPLRSPWRRRHTGHVSRHNQCHQLHPNTSCIHARSLQRRGFQLLKKCNRCYVASLVVYS